MRRRVGSVAVFVHMHDPADAEVRFAVSSRKMKGAVRRNRIRRRLKAALHELRYCLASGCDIVLVGDEQVAQLPWNRLLAEIEGVLRRIPASQVANDVNI